MNTRLLWAAILWLVAAAAFGFEDELAKPRGPIIRSNKRPTTEEAAAAVIDARSRAAELIGANTPPEGTLESLQERVKKLRARRTEAKKSSDTHVRATEPELNRRIQLMDDKIAELKREKVLSKKPKGASSKSTSKPDVADEERPLRVTRETEAPMKGGPLPPFGWNAQSPGAVGRIGRGVVGNIIDSKVTCLKVLENGKFIGWWARSSGGDFNHLVTNGAFIGKTTSYPLVFVGITADSTGRQIVEGGVYDLEVDVIATGRETHDLPNGRQSSCLVVERFDPDQPFK